MQDQPELKARAGHREVDVVQPSPLDRLAEARVVPRPLDVEHAPELVDLGFLIKGLAAGGRGQGHQRPGHGSAVPGLDAEIDRCRVPRGGLPLQGIQVLRARSAPLRRRPAVSSGAAASRPAASAAALRPRNPCGHLLVASRRAQALAQGELAEFGNGTEPSLQVGPLQG
jgi:hypothetical protein